MGAQREGVDRSGYAENGVGGDIADAVIACHGPGDGAGDEFGFVDPPVVGADAGIGLIHGAVEKTHLGVFHGGLQGGGA